MESEIEFHFLTFDMCEFDMAPLLDLSDHQDYMFSMGFLWIPSLSTVTGRGPYPMCEFLVGPLSYLSIHSVSTALVKEVVSNAETGTVNRSIGGDKSRHSSSFVVFILAKWGSHWQAPCCSILWPHILVSRCCRFNLFVAEGLPQFFFGEKWSELWLHTVDGWNPVNSPVEVGSFSYHLQGFSTIPPVVCLGFLNHQQYGRKNMCGLTAWPLGESGDWIPITALVVMGMEFFTPQEPTSQLPSSRWWFQTFLFSPRNFGKWSNLTNIFQMGWNHQLVTSPGFFDHMTYPLPFFEHFFF